MTDKTRRLNTIVHTLYSGLGGHASVVFGYLTEDFLKAYKHHLVFFGIEDLNPEFVQRCEELGLNYTFIKKEGWNYPLKLSSTLKKIKADLILCHSLPLIPVLALMKRRAGFKFVLIEHASIQLKRPIDLVWTSIASKRANKLIYLSEASRDEAIDRFNIANNKCLLIPNGIELENFRASIEQSGDFTIFSHGRLVAIKRLDVLIRALKELSEKGIDAKLSIAGDGEELPSLKKLARELGLDGYIQFLGMKTEEEISQLLSRSNVYVNSSEIESMSTALMQAMASGLACVVSDIKGNVQMVQDRVTGLHFQLNNAEDLAEKLVSLHEGAGLATSLGRAALDYASGHFSRSDMSENYKKLAAELIGSNE